MCSPKIVFIVSTKGQNCVVNKNYRGKGSRTATSRNTRFRLGSVYFYRATRMHSADYAVARCLSVRLSVRLSHAGIVFKRLNVSSFFSLSSFPVPVPNGRDGNIPTEYCHPVWYGWIRSGCLGNIICVRKYDVNVKSPPTKSSAVAERPRDASDR